MQGWSEKLKIIWKEEGLIYLWYLSITQTVQKEKRGMRVKKIEQKREEYWMGQRSERMENWSSALG